jgi:hypothetical protein
LVRSDEVEEALERVKSRYVVNRAITYSLDDAGRLLEPSRQFHLSSRTNTLLREMLDTKVENPAIPFEARSSFFQAEGGTIYVPILFEIQAEALTWKEDIGEATLFGVVQNAEGQTLYPFEHPVELTGNEDGTATYEMPIQVAPGEYTFHFGVLDDNSDKVGTKVFPVEVPAFGDGLALSSVLVYSEARQVPDIPGTPGHAFQFGSTHLPPVTGDVFTFKTTDNLGIFYFVYGYGLDQDTGQPNLTEQYVFFKDGKRLTQTAVQPLPANEEQAVGNAYIALSHFQPGGYSVRIEVIDKVKEETLTEEFEFVLKAENE